MGPKEDKRTPVLTLPRYRRESESALQGLVFRFVIRGRRVGQGFSRATEGPGSPRRPLPAPGVPLRLRGPAAPGVEGLEIDSPPAVAWQRAGSGRTSKVPQREWTSYGGGGSNGGRGHGRQSLCWPIESTASAGRVQVRPDIALNTVQTSRVGGGGGKRVFRGRSSPLPGGPGGGEVFPRVLLPRPSTATSGAAAGSAEPPNGGTDNKEGSPNKGRGKKDGNVCGRAWGCEWSGGRYRREGDYLKGGRFLWSYDAGCGRGRIPVRLHPEGVRSKAQVSGDLCRIQRIAHPVQRERPGAGWRKPHGLERHGKAPPGGVAQSRGGTYGLG